MTLAIAGLILLTYPIFYALLRRYPRRRPWAFVALGALPLLSNIPLGFLYGWPAWSGTVRGFGVSFLVMLSLALITTRPRTRGVLPFWGLFSVYALALFISAFSASAWLATVFVWWQFASLMIVFAAVGGEGYRPEIRASILTGFSIGLTYQALYSISQKAAGIVQAPGTFAHQNILGLATELALLPLVAVALGGDRRRSLMIGIAAALICIAGSGSRATMGIAGAGIVIVALLSLARRITSRKLGAVFLGVALLAIVTPFALNTLNDRFKGSSFTAPELERMRFEKAAKAMADDHPLGVGANQFAIVNNSGGYADRAGIAWQMANRSVPVHNAYLLARAETGRLGEFAFILILAVPLFVALRLSFRDRRFSGGDILLGIAVALAANAIHNTYEFAVHTFPIQALLLVNIGLIASEARNRKQVARRAQTARAQTAEVETRPAVDGGIPA